LTQRREYSSRCSNEGVWVVGLLILKTCSAVSNKQVRGDIRGLSPGCEAEDIGKRKEAGRGAGKVLYEEVSYRGKQAVSNASTVQGSRKSVNTDRLFRLLLCRASESWSEIEMIGDND
jgi:hypothetical protein